MTTSTGDRALRADAQRNHDRIIEAASDAFAEHGLDVSIEEIARRAGVGAATLYRRFPHKQELLWAIFEARIAEVEPAIAAASEAADPWEGLLEGLGAVLDIEARNLAFVQMLTETADRTQLKQAVGERVFAPLTDLFARAQASGQLRGDLDPLELPLLLRMVATAIPHAEQPSDPRSWRRYLALLADALHTPEPSRLPPR